MDFGIAIDGNGEYAFTATSDSRRLRFLADVYGQKYVTDLKLEMQTATPDEVIEYLGKNTLSATTRIRRTARPVLSWARDIPNTSF